MCGISGFFSPEGLFSEEDLENMINAQNHRGPDSNGKLLEGKVGLGHNRLSILDLSERGAQPMISSDGRYIIVYNGEVYNYNEIASQLKYEVNADFQLQSSSDTEVILEAFAAYGIEAVKYLNGMFAFAVYDRKQEELYLVRDRIGIKPLYYYWDGKNLVFSSELKTFRKMDRLHLEVNYDVLPQYLNLGYIPAPFTIYKNCFKLQPGNYLKVNKDGIAKEVYWKLSDKISQGVIENEKQAMVIISDLLASSVQYQLKSDVPFGVFLSGGIDSSLVTASAVKLSGTKINTFSIGFENQKFNEAVYAKKVADYLGTNHHEFTVTVNDALDALDEYMESYGEPFADSSGIPTLMVSRLAKKHVTVVLSGEGGDELFHGYGAYNWAQRFSNPLLFHSRFVIASLLRQSSSDRNRRAADMFSLKNSTSLRTHIFSQEQYFFSENEILDLVSDKFISSDKAEKMLSYVNDHFKNEMKSVARRLNGGEQQALFDLTYYLPDNLLVKVDRASMRYSLETRVPYLDHRLVEQAINLRSNLKDKPVPKYILKEILYQYLPKEFFDRPKQGFSIPMKDWLNNEMSFLIDEFLSKEVVERLGIVKYPIVKDLIQQFKGGRGYLSQRLWLLINLHRWFIKYGA